MLEVLCVCLCVCVCVYLIAIQRRKTSSSLKYLLSMKNILVYTLPYLPISGVGETFNLIAISFTLINITAWHDK